MNRRTFLNTSALAALSTPVWGQETEARAEFFLVGDTHYRAEEEATGEMMVDSKERNGRLVDWLNKLPGTEFSEKAGGEKWVRRWA